MFGDFEKTIRRATRVGRTQGLAALLYKIPPYIYQQIWPYLPESENKIKLNGVKSSQNQKITDSYLGEYLTQFVSDNPTYEKEYIMAIRKHVSAGDHVILVGGGEGVSTVIAAITAKPDGYVDVFEGSSEEVEKIKETIILNDVSDMISVHHSIVGQEVSLRNPPNGATLVPTEELPDCDCLGIDADGAEISILDELGIHPPKLVVEHHEVPSAKGEPVSFKPEKVRCKIQNLGYQIVEEIFERNLEGQKTEVIYLAETEGPTR